jgi:uncharacterized protein
MINKIKECDGFDWDDFNINKNWNRHLVNYTECEEIFFNEPIIVSNDVKHSAQEDRYFSLGNTNNNRLLFIVFTIRKRKIRVISARDMNKNERKIYNEKNAKDS